MPISQAVEKRIEGWKSRLIDLSRANRLLSYRHHRASSVQIVEEDPRDVLGLLAAGKKLTFDAKPEGAATPLGGGPARTGDTRLQTDLQKDALGKVLQKLAREARWSIEEQGFNTLFLAMGMLEFQMPGEPETWRAPLLLIPVQLVGKGARGDLALTAYDDETRVNPALVVKLRNEFGVEVRIPESEEGPRYDAIREAFSAAAAGREGWRIADELHLAPFSFHKIALYEDLVRHGGVIGERPIVVTLATGTPSPELARPAMPSADEMESSAEAAETCQILDADSSQEAALVAAKRGASFVLQGPPGTGKSQTIANVIADALAGGKTVLFVSEKMAALEVVQRRLAQAGLGDFCLELHSSKAKKVEVVKSLGLAWKRASEAAGATKGKAGDLAEVRAYLQQYASELGAPRGAAGIPTHRILGEAARLAGAPEVAFSIAAPGDVDGRRLKSIHEFLRSGTDVRRIVEPLRENVWRGVRRTSLGVSTVDEVRRTLNLLIPAFDELARRGAAACEAAGLPSPTTVDGHAKAADAIAHLLTTPKPAAALVAGRAWPGLSERATAAIAHGVERQALRATILSAYESSVLSLDAAAWLPRARPGGGLFGWWRRRGVRNDLRAHRKAARLADRLEPGDDLRALVRIRELTASLEGEAPWLSGVLGDGHPGLDGDWKRLSDHVAWVRRLLDLWPAGVDLSDTARRVAGGAGLEAVASAADAHRRALDALVAKWGELSASLALDDTARLGRPWRSVDAIALKAEVERMADATDTLPDWVAWQGERAKGAAEGLTEYLDAFDAGDLESRHLLNGWFRAFYRALADRVLADVPVLSAFQGRLHESKAERFRDLDGKQKAENAARATAKIREKAPSSSLGAVADSEVGVLTRQLAMQTRHMPTRKLFDKIPTLLRTLKPCLMMSPLSVATYLPPEAAPFHLVVFDEASQIGPEDAIGALARGRQAIVAGDSKQLPPTKFFESRIAESDEAPEEGIVDLESVLDDLSSVLPRHPLLWHYRSQDESLISFSNAEFYDGDLITFPNAVRDASRLGISFVHVKDGVYDPGKTRANRREAEAIADRVFLLLRERPSDSIGVVTFSTTQRDAILDAVDARRRADEQFEARFSVEAQEPVFVKNLEAVQGDERDIILFGVGYGRDAGGTFLHNFGPLNKDGGERRLNVAVSRARKQMIVFASILPEDIDPARVSKRGAKLLRTYLERAQRGLEPAAARAAPDPESLTSLVRTVHAALVAQGHAIDLNVGESGFKIDLAVRDPSRADRFVLGILCDGPAARGTRTPRDRERIRLEVLTRLGWRIHRAWAPDWLRFPDREASRLRSAIEESIRAIQVSDTQSPSPREVPAAATPRDAGATRAPAADAAGESTAASYGSSAGSSSDARPPAREAASVSESIPGVEDYRAARLRGGSPESFHEGSLDRLAAAVEKTVEVEGPVHEEVAARRVAAAWGIDRLTERVLARMEQAFADAERRGTVARRDGFFSARDGAGQAARPGVVRRPADGVERSLAQIAPEEIGAAMSLVVAACLGLSEDALVRETARLYGFQRVPESASARLREVLARVMADGHLVRDRGGWVRRA